MVDRYAGDEAWTQWFDRCQVPLCDEQWREPLWVEIESALSHAMAGKHIRNARYSREYIRNYFDTYFMLNADEARKDIKGKKKPRKIELKAKIPRAKNGLKGVVLGTIMKGEVLTMAREIKVKIDEGESVWIVNPETGEKELRFRSFDQPLYNQENESEVNQDEVTNVSEIADPSCKWKSVKAPDLTEASCISVGA